jgi:hypothetical protein
MSIVIYIVFPQTRRKSKNVAVLGFLDGRGFSIAAGPECGENALHAENGR